MAMDSRKRAMNELRGEMWSQYKPKVEAAARAEQLPPIEDVFTHLADMYCLELFAVGQATETGTVMQELGEPGLQADAGRGLQVRQPRGLPQPARQLLRRRRARLE